MSLSQNEFKVKLTLRIDWSELDYFGHVNNVSFFKYVQAARVNYWDQIGLSQFHLKTNKGPMLASCKCDFKQPLFYPGKVEIHTRVEFIKNSSFGFIHHLLNENQEIVAIANDVMVMYDFGATEKMIFPEDFRQKIEVLESRKI